MTKNDRFVRIELADEKAWCRRVMEMKTNKSLMVVLEVGRRDVPLPIQAIAGPLLGLGYIIVLPFIGLVSFILLCGYRAKQSLATR